MFYLPNTLHAFGDSAFVEILKTEIEQLDAKLLPLQQGLSVGGCALYNNFKVMFIGVTEQDKCLLVKVGLFYHGVISGCSCADDPSPTAVTAEYCEVLFAVSRVTGEASVTLVSE